MTGGQAPTVASVTANLLARLPSDVQRDLAQEDPATAIEVHFAPIGVRPLPAAAITGDDCSTDGFYDAEIDPQRPWIVYADDVSPARARFTLLHELGHHLFATTAADLLDDLDRIGRSADGAMRTEELVCHRLAGRLLVPDQLLDSVIGTERVLPRHIAEVHDKSNASWDAVAVRASERLDGPGAVVLIREAGSVSFCAATGLEIPWWPRRSAFEAGGALSRALDSRQSARPDIYRWGMSYARRLFCDTMPVHGRLAVAVLGDRPSDGHFEILQDAEPAWQDRIEYCLWCNEERTEGWCDRCHGRHCAECGRCGCSKPRVNPTCPRCGLQSPFRPGAKICRDCEADN